MNLVDEFRAQGYGKVVEHEGQRDLQLWSGALLSDLCAAVQAAYIARKYMFAVELAEHHGCRGLCVRCAERVISLTPTWGPNDPLAYHFCENCFWYHRSLQEFEAQRAQQEERKQRSTR